MVRYAPALAAVLVASAAAAQQGTPPLPALLPSETLLQVAAQGVIHAVPDQATLSTSVIADGSTPEAARRKIAEVTERMVAAVRAAGVADGAMRTEALRVAPRFKRNPSGEESDVVLGYRAETRLTIRLRDLALTTRVFDGLAAAGATGIDGPRFSFSDDTPLKARARAAAVASAQAQAADYARPFGLHVARILRISERRADVPMGEDIVVTGSRRNGPMPPVLPGEQDITADVWIDYALAR